MTRSGCSADIAATAGAIRRMPSVVGALIRTRPESSRASTRASSSSSSTARTISAAFSSTRRPTGVRRCERVVRSISLAP